MTNLIRLLSYLRDVTAWRLRAPAGVTTVPPPGPPTFSLEEDTAFTGFIAQTQPNQLELLYLGLALVPHLQPGFFDELIREQLPDGGEWPELGGVRGTNHRGLLPTGETALFLLAGTDLEKRLEFLDLFNPDHFFARQKILTLEEVKPGEPRLSGRLMLAPEYVELFTLNRISRLTLGASFPAQHLTTELEWTDLVLPPGTLAQIRDLENWVQHNETLRGEWGMKARLKPGYRALFYGPPGTGKTMTASLLGKYTSREVFRIDLSLVVSKYIGETEKNLASLFDKAQSRNWILFFDEADALFGKRTETRDAHDRYANQEVSFLLQKIEEFDGLVILASNLKSNLDPAFTRRFQAMIHFPLPSVAERLQLWQNTLPPHVPLAADVMLETLAARYELSGAAILNIVQFAALRALAREQQLLTLEDVMDGIRLEYQKEGKLL
ncbi:ATP-binding protein [Hymenobacter sp. GOD-10R]|uniref:ATP-binding protein n=1 Tax=Hymenobacter sp. GOD-10R TaxID=3093922 RepID=UPI002D78FE08|nr:ATP-binding protein [Hymenobacter sp. GOD-10R]WRQ30109.1 ATP-binding protein [Hymenobacter sp. GOD-10R]